MTIYNSLIHHQESTKLRKGNGEQFRTIFVYLFCQAIKPFFFIYFGVFLAFKKCSIIFIISILLKFNFKKTNSGKSRFEVVLVLSMCSTMLSFIL